MKIISCFLSLIAMTSFVLAQSDKAPTTFVVGAQDWNGLPISGIQVTVAPPETPQGQKSNLPPVTGVTGPNGTVTLNWGSLFDGSMTYATLHDPKNKYYDGHASGLGAYKNGFVNWIQLNNSVPVNIGPVAPSLSGEVYVKMTYSDAKVILSSLTTGIAPSSKVSKRVSLDLIKAISKFETSKGK